jgi:26S proteasome regulatory subunit N2
MVGIVSAAGLVGFLSEPDPELKVFALKQLDSQVDLLWTEIANSVGQMYEPPLILMNSTDEFLFQ